MSARRPRLLHLACLLTGASMLGGAGCSSSSSSSTAVTHPTMVQVAPEEFLGDVPCATHGTGLRRYVATLYDASEDGSGGAAGATTQSTEDQFRLPSSLPTPCLTAVGFGFVVPGRSYRATVEGYDTEDIAPLAEGSRLMVSTSDGQPLHLSPRAGARWRATCEATTAVAQTIVRVTCSQPFSAASATAKASLRVDLGRLLGDLNCGGDRGEVDHFDVSLDLDGGEPQLRRVACDAKAEAIFDNLPAHAQARIYVTAFEADGALPIAGSDCRTFTLPEATVDARCFALNPLGTLRVDLRSALDLLGLACDARLGEVQVKIPGVERPQRFSPPECLQPFEYGFAPGTAAVSVTAIEVDSSGKAREAGTLTCGGELLPGKLTMAQCQPSAIR